VFSYVLEDIKIYLHKLYC